MKLLLDQNISRRILTSLQEKYRDSAQVFLLGLQEADDKSIWDYAKQHDFAIVTKDSDFLELSLIYGIPPKVIWLRCGNQSNQYILNLLLDHVESIEEFLIDKDSLCLEIYD